MSDTVEYLDVEDLIELTILLMGEPPPIRDLGLLSSAAARPKSSAFGEDAYPDLWTKAGALLQSVVKNHALIDGNKRLGWLAAAVFLEINGERVTDVSDDVVYDLIIEVAAGDHSSDKVAEMLRSAVQS
ncbi:MAG: type II toxin-antitoxin system death-on-curing family toxin [Actinomycetota bacterium]